MSKHVDLEITLSYEDIAGAISRLRPDEFVDFVKGIEERIGDWTVIQLLKPWVDEQHRVMVQEETEDLAQKTGKCQRSSQYEDIWAHTDPHVGCILR